MVKEKPTTSTSTSAKDMIAEAHYIPAALELELYQKYRPQIDLLSKLHTFNTVEKATGRHDFWRKVSTLLERLTKISTLLQTKQVTNPNLLNPIEVFQKAIADLQPRKEQYPPLNEHLRTTTRYASKLTHALVKRIHDKQSRLATTPRQLELIATHVTPLHDIIKHLGGWGSQISTDHQVVMQHILSTFGEFFKLDQAEANFAAAIIGRHENAEDLTRLQLLQDFAKRKPYPEQNDPELAIIHGQIVFYLIDAFTNVVEPDEVSTSEHHALQLNSKAVTERFRDILQRWNDPAITRHINPEWAITAYYDYEVALKLLELGGMTIPPEAKLAVIDSAIQSFRYLLVIFDVRKRDKEEVGKINKDMRPLPIADREQFVQVIAQLENLATQEKQNQKTTTINLLSSRLENLMISLATSQDSVGSRLTRIVQSSYETATEMGFQAAPIEIDDLSYRELAPEYRAFNIIAVSSALNLVHYYLQTPEYQTTLLAFFDQKKEGDSIGVEELLKQPILNQLSQKLAEHLHNQYELSLGNQEHWWRELDHTEENRLKKEKSVVVAVQLLIAIFEYLSQTKLRDTVLLNHQDKKNIRDINLTSQTSTLESWLHTSLQEETPTNAENKPLKAVECTARAAHQLWFMAKLNRNDGDLPMNTSGIAESILPVKETAGNNIVFDPALHPFDQLHPQIKKKNRLAARIALENLVSDLSNEQSINKPLTKLARLIIYLSEMLTTNDNLSTHQTWENQACELVTWADLLTSRQYETWLMHRLAKENGLTKLNELASLDYFSLWSEKDEKTLYATIPGESTYQDLYLSSRDLDRIPLLMAAITLYLQYYFYLTEHQSSYLDIGSHKQDLEKVLSVAELVRFPDIGAIHLKLAHI